MTADAAHAQHDTAEYIGGKRKADYLLTVKGNQPGLQAAIFAKITAACGAGPDHVAVDYGHGRIVKRSIWVTSADGIEFPHASQVLRIRRDTYALDGTALPRRSCTASPRWTPAAALPPSWPGLTQGQWGIESVHWLRDTAYGEDGNTGYPATDPRSCRPQNL